MNEVEIVEGGHYKMNVTWMEYVEDLHIIKLRKVWTGFFIKKKVDGIVYSNYINNGIDQKMTMTLKKFKKDVLYKVN